MLQQCAPPPRCGAAGGSETHTTTRGGLDSCNHACERLRVKRSQHPLPYAHSFCGIGRDCSLCRHELLPAACTRTIKHTACPARRDSREAAGEGLGRSTRWTRLITPRFDQLGFLVALPSPLDKQQKGVLRRCIAGVGLHTRVCTRYPATSAAVHCAQQRTRTCSLSVHLHLKRAAGQQAVMMPLTSADDASTYECGRSAGMPCGCACPGCRALPAATRS